MGVRLGEDVAVAVLVEGVVDWVSMQLGCRHVPPGLLAVAGGLGNLPLGTPTLPRLLLLC